MFASRLLFTCVNRYVKSSNKLVTRRREWQMEYGMRGQKRLLASKSLKMD